jgi:outer membrane protein insertion porin family
MLVRRLGVGLVALGLGAGALLLALHLPVVRSAVLGWAREAVLRRAGLSLEAGRLDYNLFALSAGLADVRVAAPAAAAEPFFTAQYVAVAVPLGALLGGQRIEDVRITNATVFVHRRADGTSNLPEGGEPRTDEPDPLPVDRLSVRTLAVELVDDGAELRVQLPAVAVQLRAEGGSIALESPGQVRIRDRMTSIAEFAAGAAFDGRMLRLSDGRARADEGTLGFDGSLTVIAREPSMDLRVTSTADLAALARWGMADGDLPSGTIDVDGQVTGPFSDPRAALNVRSERLAFGELAVTDVAVRAALSTAGVDAESAALTFASGRFGGTASIPFDAAAERRVSMRWTGLDPVAAARPLAPGVAYLPTGAVTGELQLRGVGDDPARWSGSLRAETATSRNARGRVAMPGVTELTLENGAWRLTARHRVGGVAPVDVTARGTLEAGRPLADATILDGAVTVGQTSVQALADALGVLGLLATPLSVTSGAIEGTFDLRGRLGDPEMTGQAQIANAAVEGYSAEAVRAELAGRPLRPDFTYIVDATTVVASNQRFAAASATGRLGGTPLVIALDRFQVRQGTGGGVVEGTGSYEVDRARYTASLTVNGLTLPATVDLPAAGTVDGRFSGTGTLDALGGTGDLRIGQIEWQGRQLGDLTAAVTLEGRTIRVDAHAPSFNTSAAASVQADAPYAALVDVTADSLDLARLVEDLSLPTPVGGTASGTVRFEGALDDWRRGTVVADVTSVDALVGEMPLRLVGPARGRYEGERVHVDRLEAAAGETAVSASGALPVSAAAADSPGLLVVVSGGIREVAQAVAATGLTEVPLTGGEGPVALLARVTGTLEAPVLAADLEVGPGSVALEGLPPVSGLALRAHAGDGWVELREGVASYEGAGITASGRVPMAWITPGAGEARGDAELMALARNVSAAVLSPMLDRATIDQIAGSIDASLDLRSPRPALDGVTGQIQIDRLDVRAGDLPVTQRVPTRIRLRDGFARVEAWDWVGQGMTLAVAGQVRLADRQSAILASGVVDLRMLTPFVREAGLSAAGRLEPRLSITGVLDNPRVDGDLTISDAEVRLTDPRVLASDLNARAVLTRDSAHLLELTGTVNGGTLMGGGEIGHAAGSLDGRLTAMVRGMALEFPAGLRSEVDADLALAGAMPAGGAASARLTGDVTIVRSSYREPMAVVRDLLLGSRTRSLAAAGQTPPALDALALDVRVVTDEDLLVDNNYGRAQLGADLRLIGTAAAPALSGRAEVREGGRLFVGRNVYTVNFGAIDFANPAVIEPRLDVRATTRAGGEDIEVALTGLAESPTVDLRSTSNPDLGQAEIASLLLTGRELENLDPGDAAFVGTQVLGNFSAEVLGFASRSVGLDTLRLGGVDDPTARQDPYAEVADIDPTTRLTFGKGLGSNLDVTYSQSLRDGDAQTWIVDYIARRGLELRLVSNDENLRSYGLRHDLAIGTASRPIRSAAVSRRSPERDVSAVNVTGTLALPEARVRAVLRLEAGERFDVAAWQQDHDRMEALYHGEGYLLVRVAPRRVEDAGGVALTYEVTAGPLTSIAVTGIEADSGLRSDLQRAWIETVFDDFVADEAERIVRARLAQDGYLRPVIAAQVRGDAAMKSLEVIVEPGDRSTRRSVRVEGVPETLAADITAHLGTVNLVQGGAGDPGSAERETLAFLRGRGYLRAAVRADPPVFDENAAVLPLQVTPGPLFTVSRLSFTGASALPEETLQREAALEAGTPYDPLVIDAARGRLAALHRREGFGTATVTATPAVRDESGSVEIAFDIIEGARDVLADVVVVGNRAVDPAEVTRTAALEPGEPLRSEDVLEARTRLFASGLFRRVDISVEPVEAGSDVEGVVAKRLRVTVEEWPALRLRYGLLVSERWRGEVGEERLLTPGFSADLTRRTLFGRAVTTGLVVGLRRLDQRGRAFVSMPTLLALPIQTSFIAERSHEEFEGATFVTNRTAFGWEQRARVGRRVNLSLSFNFERNHTFDTAPPDPFVPALDVTVNLARLNLAGAWDSRDDPLDTTSGLLASSSLEYSPEALGSDIRFARQVTQAYYFRPWRGVVFASAARLGLVAALDDQELIPSERFYSGGPRSVRGVAESGLGPRDFFGDAAGGEVMLVLNQEARVPLYRWLRGVAFVDAGNIFAERRDLSLGSLVGALGVGLRLTTPFALLRVDFAKTVWGGSGLPTSTGRWIFGIGQAF